MLKAIPQLRFAKRAVAIKPHPQKHHRGGEDAFIADDCILAVADGVGGYADSGVNPAIFTRQIMEFTLEHVRNSLASDHTGVPAAEAVEAGLKKTKSKGTVGGCPVTALTLLGERRGSVMNLGDCGTIIYRKADILYRTTVQQHYFNCPFQLPDDSPSLDGMSATLELQPGDVVFQASDGVWDNVPDDVILKALKKIALSEAETQETATEIAALAAAYGLDKRYVSPFALAAHRQGHSYTGGKLDDVTVVIAVVAEASSQSTNASSQCPTLIRDVVGVPGVA